MSVGDTFENFERRLWMETAQDRFYARRDLASPPACKPNTYVCFTMRTTSTAHAIVLYESTDVGCFEDDISGNKNI